MVAQAVSPALPILDDFCHGLLTNEVRERLQLLQPGQQLMTACQIRHGYGAGVFALENCELIRVDPRPLLARAS